ncbi:hypothetical protein QBC32DRAFT_329689 [Pseudoneurospora amorphoporcata]|uniref:Uncharacterized protein n=1 Tax=Pseudoneurospora amorphoporcata TaxID=241081 RepID=A0AAN6SJN6_9PEZI|nr:hypothetical protein QBC32DRAFT_329689 [Pseudoneurospora amorphoporcata]
MQPASPSDKVERLQLRTFSISAFPISPPAITLTLGWGHPIFTTTNPRNTSPVPVAWRATIILLVLRLVGDLAFFCDL